MTFEAEGKASRRTRGSKVDALKLFRGGGKEI